VKSVASVSQIASIIFSLRFPIPLHNCGWSLPGSRLRIQPGMCSISRAPGLCRESYTAQAGKSLRARCILSFCRTSYHPAGKAAIAQIDLRVSGFSLYN